MPSTLLRIEGFRSSILNNERDLRLYLPPGYSENPDSRYPVLYAHDGQNLFNKAAHEPDPLNPFVIARSWSLHHTADRLIAEGLMEEVIIVGIFNMGGERSGEYMHGLEGIEHERDRDQAEPRGELYERFLVEELKPFIDSVFRTKRDAENTGLIGSSRGGQITYHIGFSRPDIFGKLGILSPYFYYVNPLTLIEHRMYASFPSRLPLSKIWIDLGGREGVLVMEKHVRQVVAELLEAGYEPDSQLAFYFDPDAAHTEADWEKRAHLPLLHLFGKPAKLSTVSLLELGTSFFEQSKLRLLPTAEYDNGWLITPLSGTFATADSDAASVDHSGGIIPKEGGAVTVEYEFQGKRTNARLTLS